MATGRSVFYTWSVAVLLFVGTAGVAGAQDVKLLNVSYDPTRELYAEINEAFARKYQAETGKSVVVEQSHGGSGKQARAVIDGLEADIVTLALAFDVDALSKQAQLIPANWQSRLPHNSTPYSSTIVFLVRKGNPRQIKDWDDLTRDGVKVITPHPKTSGGARWNYLAAWGFELRRSGGDREKAREFIRKLYANVSVLDTGARGSTTTFVNRRAGDVLIGWENDALLVAKGPGGDAFEVVYPSVSILAEPPVALVDQYVDRHATRAVAEAYLKFLFTDEAQEIAARHHYRPQSQAVAERFADHFKAIERFPLSELHPGGWDEAQKVHFADGGIFDQVTKKH